MKTLLYTTLFAFTFTNINAQCTYFTKIVSGTHGSHCLGIKNDSTLWSWGNNAEAELGDGTQIDKLIPTQIGTSRKWISIASGGNHSLAISADGKLWAWGLNADGQLGDGTNFSSLYPIQVGSATNWVSISAGRYHSLGITADGKLWAWGWNGYGQLGDGTIVSKSTPAQVGTATNWARVIAVDYHSAGITSDGKLWTWGLNLQGELGDSSTIDKLSPIEVGKNRNWVCIAGEGGHTLAITSDGKLWGWGWNGSGELGDGTIINQFVPTQIGNNSNWVDIAAGDSHSLAISSDGKLWACGGNNRGQLGDGSNNDHLFLNQIGTNTNWTSISGGDFHSLGLTSKGASYSWGLNDHGQLGDGTNADNNNPNNLSGANKPAYTSLVSLNSSSSMFQNSVNNYAVNCTGLIATVSQFPNYLSRIIGNTTAKVWLETTQSKDYVIRHYQITPSNNVSNAIGRVTLYFKQSEFDAFNTKNTVKLPTNPNDATCIANLLIEKHLGTSSSSTGLPNTYSGAVSNINPNDVDIVWNAGNNWWEVSFITTGFGGFFIKTTSIPLEINNVNNFDSNTLNIYPNPANSELTIDGIPLNSASPIVIYDIYGKEIIKIVNSSFKSQIKIDISNYANGIYIVRCGEKSIRFEKGN